MHYFFIYIFLTWIHYVDNTLITIIGKMQKLSKLFWIPSKIILCLLLFCECDFNPFQSTVHCWLCWCCFLLLLIQKCRLFCEEKYFHCITTFALKLTITIIKWNAMMMITTTLIHPFKKIRKRRRKRKQVWKNKDTVTERKTIFFYSKKRLKD